MRRYCRSSSQGKPGSDIRTTATADGLITCLSIREVQNCGEFIRGRSLKAVMSTRDGWGGAKKIEYDPSRAPRKIRPTDLFVVRGRDEPAYTFLLVPPIPFTHPLLSGRYNSSKNNCDWRRRKKNQ